MLDVNIQSLVNQNGAFAVGDEVKLKDRGAEIATILSIKVVEGYSKIVVETDKGTFPLDQIETITVIKT